jgi:hypothetical protein
MTTKRATSHLRRFNPFLQPTDPASVCVSSVVRAHASVQGHLLDHLVGAGEEGLGKRNPKRTRRLDINDQLDLCDLFNRQIRGPDTVEDLSSVKTD